MNRLFSASILLRGAAAVIGQSLLIRELLVIFYGNELTFGIILSVWLLSGALGSIFAAYLTRHTRSPLALLALIQLFAGIWLVLAIVLVRSSRFFLGVGFGEVLTLLQIITIAVSLGFDPGRAPVAFALGMGLGTIAWYALLLRLIITWSERLHTSTVVRVQQGFAVLLVCAGSYMVWHAWL